MANPAEDEAPNDGTPNSFVSAVSELNNEDVSAQRREDPARNGRSTSENDPSPHQPRTLFVEVGDDDDDVPQYLRRHANLRTVVDVEVAEDEINEEGDGDSVNSSDEANDLADVCEEAISDRLQVLIKLEDTTEQDIEDSEENTCHVFKGIREEVSVHSVPSDWVKFWPVRNNSLIVRMKCYKNKS